MKKHLLATALSIFFIVQYGHSETELAHLGALMPLTGSGTCTPQVFCPPDVTVTESQVYDLTIAYSPSVTLNDPLSCETPVVTYEDKEVYSDDCNRGLERWWMISSAPTGSGSTGFAFCKQMVYVTPDCELLCPADVCVSLDDDLSTDDLGTAYASGPCSITSLDYEDVESFECDGATLVTRRWSASFRGYDNCEFNCAQLITVNDNTGPTFYNTPSDIVVDNSCKLVHWEEPKVIDNCARTTLTSNHRPGLTFSHGSHTVVYTATDQCGNASTTSFVVTVNNPDLDECQDDIIVTADAEGTAIVDWNPPLYNGSCGDCPPAPVLSGFMHVGSHNGSNYYVSRFSSSWPYALDYSTKRQLELVKINSEEENAYVASLVSGHSLFIGLSDHQNEGTFQWSDGSSLGYSNWFVNQPNNLEGNQDYVEILKSGEWNDVDNDTRTCFLIEVPCDFVHQVTGPRPGTEFKPGTYTVSYEIQDGCGLSTCCTFDITVLHSTEQSSENIIKGITYSTSTQPNKQEVSIHDINLFPNPSSDFVTITGLVKEDIVSAAVVNNLNQVIYSLEISESGEQQVDITELDHGLYYVSVLYKSGQSLSKRLIKL